jgi:hypothetical protein
LTVANFYVLLVGYFMYEVVQYQETIATVARDIRDREIEPRGPQGVVGKRGSGTRRALR